MDLWWVAAALSSAVAADGDRWAEELARLDLLRARAFAQGAPGVLDRVYVDRAAAAADTAMIQSYASRGARVVGAVLAIRKMEVVHARRDRVELSLIDQLGPAFVVFSNGNRRSLPRDRPTARTVVLDYTDQGWKISKSRLR